MSEEEVLRKPTLPPLSSTWLSSNKTKQEGFETKDLVNYLKNNVVPQLSEKIDTYNLILDLINKLL